MNTETRYTIRPTSSTTIEQLRAKVAAFKELYGSKISMRAWGHMDTNDGDYVYAGVDGLAVVSVGQRYLTVIADGEPCKILMDGLTELVLSV